MKKQRMFILLLLLSLFSQGFAGDSIDNDFYHGKFLETTTRKLYDMGLKFEANNDPANALLSYLTVIKKSQNQTDSIELRIRALAKTKAGIIYFSHGDFTQASHLFHSSLKIFVDLKDMDGKANLLNNLGTVYYKWRDYEEALGYFNRAAHISDSLNLTHSLLLAYNNIGAVHLAMDNIEDGLDLFEKSLAFHSEKGDSAVFHLLSNIGVVHQKLNNDSMAYIYYERAHSVAKLQNRPEQETIILINKAEIHLRALQYGNALSLLHQSRETAIAEGYNSLLRSIFLALNRTYSAKGDDKNSLVYYKKFLDANELIYNAEKHKALRETQVLYDVEKKNRQISILQTEKEIQQAIIKQQKTILFLFLLFSGIILSMLIVIGIRQLKLKSSFSHLINQNIEIAENEDKNLGRKSSIEDTMKSLLQDEIRIRESTASVLHIVEKYQLNSSFLPERMAVIFEKSSQLFNELNSKSKTTLHSEGVEYENLSDEEVKGPGLNEFSKNKIAFAIMEIMNKEKPYLNDDFSLDKLTLMVGSNKKYVSQVLNSEFGKSFNHFINEFRIREARKMLTDSKCQHFTIEAVSSFVGFKSKTSFNQAFKLFTGLTPSYYKRATRLAFYYRGKKASIPSKTAFQNSLQA